MQRLFDPAVMVLACDRCGAPLEAGAGQSLLTCRYCGASNMLGAAESIGAVPELSKEELARRLAAQVGRERAPSALVQEYMDGEQLAPWREREAMASWLECRRTLRALPGQAGLFYELTRLLADAANRANDGLRERALLETGYRYATMSRHRTVFASLLAQRAMMTGDSQSAQAWIGRCDSGVDDLEAHSALQLARAMLFRAQGRREQVLGILGTAEREAASYPGDDVWAAVLRAEALERGGQVQEAVRTLEAAVVRRWPKARAEVVLIAERLGGCEKAMLGLAEARGARVRGVNLHNSVVLGIFALLWGGLFVAGIYGVMDHSWGWLAGVIIGGGAAIFLIKEEISLIVNWNIWRSPIWGTVKSIPVTPKEEESGVAEVELDGGQGSYRVAFENKAVVRVGMRAMLRKAEDSIKWLD